MKTTALILLASLLVQVVHAQKNQWGVHIGTNATTFQFDVKGLGPNPNSRRAIAPELGISYQYLLTPQVVLVSDLTTGVRLNKTQGSGIRYPDSVAIKWTNVGTWRLSSLALGLKIYPLHQSIRTYVLAGLQLECWHSGKNVLTEIDSLSTQVFTKYDDRHNTFYWGYFVGAGYQRRIGKYTGYIEGRYQVGHIEFQTYVALHSYSYVATVGVWFGGITSKTKLGLDTYPARKLHQAY